MQMETEKQLIYPIKEAEFIKYRGRGDETLEFVRLFRISEYGYNIATGHVYDKDLEIPGDIVDQTITCQYPSTAKWIYEKCRLICRACCNGDIITDIPFNCE